MNKSVEAETLERSMTKKEKKKAVFQVNVPLTRIYNKDEDGRLGFSKEKLYKDY
jgi:hypothetical protein